MYKKRNEWLFSVLKIVIDMRIMAYIMKSEIIQTVIKNTKAKKKDGILRIINLMTFMMKISALFSYIMISYTESAVKLTNVFMKKIPEKYCGNSVLKKTSTPV